MEKIFKDFRELNLEQFEDIFIPDIDLAKASITGTPHVNYVSNKVFMWMFKEENVKDFISIFALLRQPRQGYIRTEFRINLDNKCKEIIKNQQICPVEPMLYASKMVNRIISNDVEVQEDIADVIVEVAKHTDTDLFLPTLNHIISHWNWMVQIKIALLVAGKLGNTDIIKTAYNRFLNHQSYEFLKFEIFKMLIYSKNPEFIPYIVSIISSLDKESSSDKRIVNFFKENFDKFMGKDGILVLKQYFDTNYNYISNYGRSIIQKMLRDYINELDNSTLLSNNNTFKDFTKIKELCMKYSKQKENENLKREIIGYLFDNKESVFSDTVYCLRYTQDGSLVQYLKDAILRRKNHKYSVLKNAIMTMGFLKSEDEAFIKYLAEQDQSLKYAMYGYYILQNSETYCLLMAEELLVADEYSKIQSINEILKEVINVNNKLKSIIKERFKNIILTGEKSERLNAMLNIQPFWKDIIDKDLMAFLYEQMGYPDKEVRFNKDEQAVVLHITRELIPNYGRNLFKYLDYVIKNRERFEMNIRQLATNILLNDFEPSAPQ